MRMLVLGAGGMLGHMACRTLSDQFKIFGTTRSGWSRDDPLARFLPKERWLSGLSAYHFDSVVTTIHHVEPAVVLNCIGIVKQREQAMNALSCIEINSLFPHRLAAICDLAGSKLIHVSTDCVFSGSRGMRTEDDIPDPVDLYGRSKLLGEVSTGNALTLRTSIIGPQLTTKTGLLEWALSQEGKEISGFAKAIYTGLTTDTLCRVIQLILRDHFDLCGIWQVASEPISKYDLLVELNDLLDLRMTIQRDEHFLCDRSLDGSRFRERTSIHIPTWSDMLRAMKGFL